MGIMWGEIERLMPFRNGVWCYVGDFNEMISITEKDGTRTVAPIKLTMFRDFLNTTGSWMLI